MNNFHKTPISKKRKFKDDDEYYFDVYSEKKRQKQERKYQKQVRQIKRNGVSEND